MREAMAEHMAILRETRVISEHPVGSWVPARFHPAEEEAEDRAITIRLLRHCQVRAVVEDDVPGAFNSSRHGLHQPRDHLGVPAGGDQHGQLDFSQAGTW